MEEIGGVRKLNGWFEQGGCALSIKMDIYINVGVNLFATNPTKLSFLGTLSD